MPYLILVELTSKEEFDESWESILSKKKKVGFKIEDILSTSIPTVRARNHPVQL